ncbi:MAG: DUF2705 family protein [Oscillospiraceae bacterium]|nr:DUF2705 family protein [Oscillospiraceae bacterium]
MKFFKLVRFDFQHGIFREWKKFCLSAVLITVVCMMFDMKIVMTGRQIELPLPTFADYLAFLFYGMKVYVFSTQNPFRIPINWLMLHLFLAYIVGNYPFQDLMTYGQSVLLRAKSRGKWWVSKCLWSSCCVLLFYLESIVISLFFAAVTGKVSMSISPQIQEKIIDVSFLPGLSPETLVLNLLIVPLITSIAISLIQLCFALILRPVYSYLVVSALLLSSAYIYSPALIGNYLMAARNSIALQNGINASYALPVSAAIAVLAVVTGKIIFKKYDIIDTGKGES